MDPDMQYQRLSLISTNWSLLAVARLGETDKARAAKHQLLERYGGAVHRYLLGTVRDADAADDLFQDFACRFLNGAMDGVNAGRGRFRDFLKGALGHLAIDHHRREKRRLPELPRDYPDAADHADGAEQEAAFRECWRDDLLARTWAGLEELEGATGRPLFSVLRFRADHPQMRSDEMAERLGTTLGKGLTPANVRQLLHRAREQFADLLLADVAATLVRPAEGDLEDELRELGLLEYCRPALARRHSSSPPAADQ
jgi:RNA polymerase sigma factor (sigma-70 family)